jgi:hypothetical protein
MKGFLKRSA